MPIDAASDALFSALIATAVDGIVVIDARGVVQIYSPACERLFGYSPDEVIGKNVKLLMPRLFGPARDFAEQIGELVRTVLASASGAREGAAKKFAAA